MNTYFGNFSGFLIRSKTTDDVQSSSLPKSIKHSTKFRSAFDLRTPTLDLKGTLKRQVTAFSTLLRPRSHDIKLKNASNETLNFGSNNDIFQDGKRGRSLDELINKLIPTPDYYPDKKYKYTMLLCCRLFLLPVKLLEKLTVKMQEQVKENEEHEKLICKHFVMLLYDWSNMFPLDFKDKRFMKTFNKSCQICLKSNVEVSNSINQISNNLVETFKNILQYIDESKQFFISCDDEETSVLDVCKQPMKFAQQLTILEYSKMSKIYSEQLLDKFIVEDITCSRLDLSSQSSAIELYVSWFNRLSYLVATVICEQKERKDRVKLIDFFIEVAKYCSKIGNYNSMMAIITGLNMNPVLRMRKTWNNTNQSGFKKLESTLSPKLNFHKYRTKLKSKFSKKGEKYFIVPVFSLFVKDLYFLNEGIKNDKDEKIDNIDYNKLYIISMKVREFEKHMHQKIKFDRDGEIMDFLINTPVLSEDILYKKSFDVEKPLTNFERDRYQSVRVKLSNRVK